MLSERLMNFSLFYVQEPFANRSSAGFIRKVAESWFLSDSCVLRVDMLQINRAGIYISHFCEHQDQFTRRTGWPTLWRSEHGGADECCRLHQRFKSSCKIQNWAEKTLHHQQQLVTVVCTLSTLIPIYNGLTTRWCYSGSAVSLTVCGSHVAPPTIRAEMWSIRLTRAVAGHTIMCSQRPRRHNTLRTSRVCEMLRKKLVQPAGATAEVNQRLAEMQQIGETVTIWTRKSWRQRVPK